MPYYTHPDYKIYEFNKKLLQRTEVFLNYLKLLPKPHVLAQFIHILML